MAVEIFILSGARQGERLVLDEKEFRAGAASSCEICFDARRDTAVKGRVVLFRLQDDGWYVRASGGEVWIDQTPLVGSMRISSGNVIRMSESGPDFLFGIVGSPAAHVHPPLNGAGRLHAPVALPLPPPAGARGQVPPAPPPPLLEIVETRPPTAAAMATSSPPTIETPRHVGASPAVAVQRERPWPPLAVGALALGIAMVCLLFGIVIIVAVRSLSPQPIVVTVPPSVNPTPVVPAPPTSTAPPAPTPPTPITPTEPAPKPNPPAPLTPPPKDPGAEAKPPVDAQLREAMFLVQLEKAESVWPLATCVAVGPNTLLTTARAAEQLATKRSEGFKAWIARPDTDFKEEVQDVRVNSVYADLAEKNADEYVFYDVGLLTVRGDVKQAPLASAEELRDADRGMPVTCFGYLHLCEEITRYNKKEFQPSAASGKTLVISALPETREELGPARLLQVGMPIPKDACVDGSPVVKDGGTIVGVYSQAVARSGSANVPKDLHYAPMVNPRMINAWLKNHDEKMWPAAKPTVPAEKTQAQP